MIIEEVHISTCHITILVVHKHVLKNTEILFLCSNVRGFAPDVWHTNLNTLRFCHLLAGCILGIYISDLWITILSKFALELCTLIYRPSLYLNFSVIVQSTIYDTDKYIWSSQDRSSWAILKPEKNTLCQTYKGKVCIFVWCRCVSIFCDVCLYHSEIGVNIFISWIAMCDPSRLNVLFWILAIWDICKYINRPCHTELSHQYMCEALITFITYCQSLHWNYALWFIDHHCIWTFQ